MIKNKSAICPPVASRIIYIISVHPSKVIT
jgi:hypothetical protein